MRIAIVGCALLARIPVAIADPDPVAEEVAEVPLQTAYMQLGWQIGSDEGQTFSALRADAGYHLGHTQLWVHAQLATGSPVGPFLQLPDIGDKHYVSGSLRQAAVGIEGRMCGGAAICGVLGIDVGYESLVYVDTDATDRTKSVSFQSASVVVIPRLQLDLGGDHVRVRPGLEVPLGPHVSGTHVSLALAFQI